MVTARQAHVIKRLIERNGILGKVAARYIEAGFRVRINPGIEALDMVAVKEGLKLGIKVLVCSKINNELLEKFKLSCEKHGFKPVIILYGSAPRLSKEDLDKLLEKGIVVKRVRAG